MPATAFNAVTAAEVDDVGDRLTAAEQEALDLAWADIAADALLAADGERRQLNLVRLRSARRDDTKPPGTRSWHAWSVELAKLSDEQRDTLHKMAGDRQQSAEAIRTLLAVWGIAVSRNAARFFRRILLGVGLTTARTAARARTALAVQQSIGPTTTLNAIAAHVESQMLMEISTLLRAESTGEFDARRWEQIGKAVYIAGRNRREIERAGGDSGRKSQRGVGGTVGRFANWMESEKQLATNRETDALANAGKPDVPAAITLESLGLKSCAPAESGDTALPADCAAGDAPAGVAKKA
jgi:hypothetical protein